MKAYSLLTGHPTKPKSLWRDLRDELPAELVEKANLYPKDYRDFGVRNAARLRELVAERL